VTPGSNKKVWWTCDKDHEWEATVRNIALQFNVKTNNRDPRKEDHLLAMNEINNLLQKN